MYAAFADVDLHSHKPLEIRDVAGEAGLLSYKAPWNRESAKLALAGTGLYEASGNMFWMNPFPSDADMTTCAGDTPSWKSIHGAADAFRVDDKAFEMGSAGPARQNRILFPGVMAVHAPTLDVFIGDTFPGNMQVVTGHVLIYAWYLAMFEALQGGHALWVASLFQAALTVTIRAHVCASTPELATLSIRLTNEASTIANVSVDSFPSFAHKLRLALAGVETVAKRLEHCAAQNIRFNGTLVYRSMLLAAMSYVERRCLDARQAGGRQGSQWRLATIGDASSSSGASTPVHRIECKRDLVQCFLRARRMQRRT